MSIADKRPSGGSEDQPSAGSVSGNVSSSYRPARTKKELEEAEKELEDALESTFPASDPVSIIQPQRPSGWTDSKS